MIKTSVIIPVYNSEKYLQPSLESVINQTCRDIEIICVNDGSTDKSLEILNEYAQKDKRLKIYSQEKQGAGAARNLGLSKASGETVIFLDSDDVFDKKLVEILYNKHKQEDSDIVFCNYKVIDNENNICDVSNHVGGGRLTALMQDIIFFQLLHLMFGTKCLESLL